MRKLKYFLAVPILVAGCQTLAPTDMGPGKTREVPIENQETLHAMDRWQLDGKIAYRNLGKHGSARISWEQAGDQFDIYLSAPFGTRTTRIRGTYDLAEMTQPDGTDFAALSIPELTRRELGFSLPFDDLLWWIRGLPAQNKYLDHVEYNDNGLLTNLEQSGWQLTFDRYVEQDGLMLPGRIKGWRHDIQFALVIYLWQAR